MGYDIRANNGRCPPFLLGGCILLCIVLVCNWWSFSSQNYELVKQIDILENQMRICCTERDSCTSDKNKIELELGELKVQTDQLKRNNKDTLNGVEKDLTLCKTELDSYKKLDTSKSESIAVLRSTLDEKKEEINQLQEKVKQLTAFKEETLKKNNNEEHDATDINKEKDGERDQLMAN